VNPPPNQTNVRIVSAVLETPNGRWVFPAVEGMSTNDVRNAIRERLAPTPIAGVADDLNASISYPDTAPVTISMTPLGWPANVPFQQVPPVAGVPGGQNPPPNLDFVDRLLGVSPAAQPTVDPIAVLERSILEWAARFKVPAPHVIAMLSQILARVAVRVAAGR